MRRPRATAGAASAEPGEEHIHVYLPRDVDKMRPLRQAAVDAGLDQIVRLIDERHAFIP